MVSIIISGFGNVGHSLVKIMHDDKDYLKNEFGFETTIKAIVEFKGSIVNNNGINMTDLLNLKKVEESPDWVDGKTAVDVIKEVDADILVECSWASKDGEPAFTTIKIALENKMHIASSNKPPFYLRYKFL